ncbi:amino acid ABC transporter permease [Pantanalinema sp. GBBB05]|uniref:amino acid ABC transporter permease n=1 Tax=Pantanalinema sp. GBBB05 TaxID=2604139 RepID=UPI001D5B0721|nr:amino acid ABC transporter permease [Pantanalinema sp. GBBB05]
MSSAPASSNTAIVWLRKNLFNTWYNSLLTIACFIVIYQVITGVAGWVTNSAQWAVVTTNLRLFFMGRYPVDLAWRLGWVAAIVVALLGLGLTQVMINHQPTKARLKQSLFILLPIAVGLILWLMGGGFGLTPVSTNLWGGLLLTLFVSITSIVLAFPLGVLLALGRRSSLPVLRGACTTYIEIIRGLPLIGILFMAQVMLPLVLPGQWRLDRVLRAIAGLVLFNAAYLAENVRGGLQSIPRGQTEAAKALGLNLFQTLLLVVLPQALRIAVPSIVGQFISLFKDTSLLSLFALLELTGIGRSILAQPQFLGRNAEVYLFIGLIYWLFCYTMSLLSRRLEPVK